MSAPAVHAAAAAGITTVMTIFESLTMQVPAGGAAGDVDGGAGGVAGPVVGPPWVNVAIGDGGGDAGEDRPGPEGADGGASAPEAGEVTVAAAVALAASPVGVAVLPAVPPGGPAEAPEPGSVGPPGACAGLAPAECGAVVPGKGARAAAAPAVSALEHPAAAATRMTRAGMAAMRMTCFGFQSLSCSRFCLISAPSCRQRLGELTLRGGWTITSVMRLVRSHDEGVAIVAGRAHKHAEHNPHRSRHPYALRGCVWCGVCERRMQSHWVNDAGASDREATLRKVAECDAELARYRAALDSGASPATVAGWIAETEAEKARHTTGLRQLPESRGRMTATRSRRSWTSSRTSRGCSARRTQTTSRRSSAS